jgi:hypothetical protein
MKYFLTDEVLSREMRALQMDGRLFLACVDMESEVAPKCATVLSWILRKRRCALRVKGIEIRVLPLLWRRWLTPPPCKAGQGRLAEWHASRRAISSVLESIGSWSCNKHSMVTLSVSHCAGRAIAVGCTASLDAEIAVGVDIERRGRFVATSVFNSIRHPLDCVHDVDKLTQWCAKEAAYKTIWQQQRMALSGIWLSRVSDTIFKFGLDSARPCGIVINLPTSNYNLCLAFHRPRWAGRAGAR